MAGDAQALLSRLPLFHGCAPPLLEALANAAERRELAANQAIIAFGTADLLVVERGALRLQLGAGPAVALGVGDALNFAGFLGLAAEGLQAQRPSDDGGPYRVRGLEGAPPRLSTEGGWLSPPKEHEQPRCSEEQLCFYHLCPSAASSACGGDLGPALTVTGVRDSSGPAPLDTASLLTVPGAVLTSLQLEEEQKVHFESKREQLIQIWQSLTRWFAPAILPGVPEEVMWTMAEVCTREHFPKGAPIAVEGDGGKGCHDILVVASGTVGVGKLAATCTAQEQPPQPVPVGTLKAGAVIGGLLLQSGNVPRAASATAESDVVALRVSRADLMAVLARFPGALASVEETLMEGAKLMTERLPVRAQVLRSLSFFEECDKRFVADLAATAERRVVLGGRTVVEQGVACSSLWILEQGFCSVEARGTLCSEELRGGACFAERTLLGVAHSASSTVRASTPVALLLSLPRAGLISCLEQHREEQANIDRLKKMLARPDSKGPSNAAQASQKASQPPPTPVAGPSWARRLRAAELFGECRGAFLEALDAILDTHLYLTGQTIVVEGHREADARMYHILGGMVVAERQARRVARMTPGATFGELAMLGVTEKRPTTIRTMTFVMVLALRRSAFFRALQQNPSEEQHFRRLLAASRQEDTTTWPCLQDVAPAVLHALDVKAEAIKCASKETTLSEPAAEGCAVLILNGEVSVVDASDQEVKTLTRGCCFNEQVLLGARPHAGMRLLPKTACEARVLSLACWREVLDEYPEEVDHVQGAVLAFMAEAAEKQLALPPGRCALRQALGFLRHASQELVQGIRGQLAHRLVMPGEAIECGHQRRPSKIYEEVPRGAETPAEGGNRMEVQQVRSRSHSKQTQELEPFICLVLDGRAVVDDGADLDMVTAPTVEPGTAAFEASTLGLYNAPTGTLRAAEDSDKPCLVQLLTRTALQKVLQCHPDDNSTVQRLIDEVSEGAHRELWQRLHSSPTFVTMDAEFVKAVCQGVKISVHPANSSLVRQGQQCVFGESEFFLVLGGKVHLESDQGTVFRTMHAGQLVGEVGAFGLMDKRTATANVWRDGLACCACFDGHVLAEALKVRPEGVEAVRQAMQTMTKENSSIEQDRRRWLGEVAVPALRKVAMLSGCPEDFFQALASTLTERSFSAGATIVAQGEITKELLVLLEGSAEMVGARSATHLGDLRAGGAFGEVNCLGLFSASMASLRASSDCRVLRLPEPELRRALAVRGREEVAQRFRTVATCRHEQVAQGAPVALLGLDAPAASVSVRTIALLSEKLVVETGAVVEAVGDADPRGPSLVLLTHGRLGLEMSSNGSQVSTLTPGSIIREGIPAEFGAQFRAENQCTLYRIKDAEFRMALLSVAEEQWPWRFKMQERAISDKMRARLVNARGRVEARVPHKRDKEIREYKVTKKERAALRAAGEWSEPTRLFAQTLPAVFQRPGSKGSIGSTDGKAPLGSSSSSMSALPAFSTDKHRIVSDDGLDFLLRPDDKKRSRRPWPGGVPPNRALDSYPILRMGLPSISQQQQKQAAPGRGSQKAAASRSMPALRPLASSGAQADLG